MLGVAGAGEVNSSRDRKPEKSPAETPSCYGEHHLLLPADLIRVCKWNNDSLAHFLTGRLQMFKPALQLSFCLSCGVGVPAVPEVKIADPAFALWRFRSRTEAAMKPASTALARFRIPFSGTFARRSISGLR